MAEAAALDAGLDVPLPRRHGQVRRPLPLALDPCLCCDMARHHVKRAHRVNHARQEQGPSRMSPADQRTHATRGRAPGLALVQRCSVHAPALHALCLQATAQLPRRQMHACRKPGVFEVQLHLPPQYDTARFAASPAPSRAGSPSPRAAALSGDVTRRSDSGTASALPPAAAASLLRRTPSVDARGASSAAASRAASPTAATLPREGPRGGLRVKGRQVYVGVYHDEARAAAAYDRAALKILGSAANLNVRARTRGAYLRGALDCFARSLPSASCF